MIRSPLARSAELARGAPLRRKTWMRQRRATPRRSGRERDPAFLAWAHRQPCAVRIDPPDPNRITPCGGRIELDHQGARPLGRKSNDIEGVPVCHDHHDQRTNHHGAFRALKKPELRAWKARAIARTQAAWRARR